MDRSFKGIWIPKELWLDERLSALEKIILAEIDSLDKGEGCWANNEALAEFCQCSTSKVSKSIAKLQKLLYVAVENFDGRTRILRSLLAQNARQTGKTAKSAKQNLPNRNNIDYKIIKENNKRKEKRSKNDSALIQKIYDIFLQKFNKSPNMFKLTPMRRAKIQARLTDAGEEMLTKAIENTANSSFHMGENDRGWKADLDFIVRSYEQVEKLANMTPRPPKGEEAIVLPRHLREEMEEFQRGLAEDLANERS